MKELKESISKKDSIRKEVRFYIKVPLEQAHNHNIDDVSRLTQPINSDLIEQIYDLVAQGFTNTKDIMLHLRRYVKNDLFKGKDEKPPESDRSYYPTSKDVSNHIHIAITKQKYFKMDQDELERRIEKWKEEDPLTYFFLRKYEDHEENEVVEEKEEVKGNAKNKSCNAKKGFLYVSQEKWQRELLIKYGNTLFLMDATYKTTKYSLPLFFNCVKTNVDYVVCAEFVLHKEDTDNITEALQILKQWNPTWYPKNAMTDFSEMEINAINTVFEDTFVMICDFHREQSWERWVKKSEHDVEFEQQKELLSMMRSIAYSRDVLALNNAVSRLRGSRIYNNNKKVQNWMEKYWLPEIKRWAKVYRNKDADLVINTNNSIERQNKCLKYDYISRYSDKSLTGLLILIRDFYLPDAYKKYIQSNLKLSSSYRKYNDNIPEWLQERPHNFIKHVLQRLHTAQSEYTKEDVNILSKLKYQVKSFAGPIEHPWYIVNFADPSCECADWDKHHFPCKHMCALFQHHIVSWNDLATSYRESPFLKRDLTVDGTNLVDDEDMPSQTIATNDHEVNCDTREKGLAHNTLPLPTRKKDTSLSLQKKVRNELKEINDITFDCDDANALKSTISQLHLVKEELLKKCNIDSGLKIITTPIKQQSKYKQKLGRWKRSSQKVKHTSQKSIKRVAKVFSPIKKKKKDWRVRSRVGKKASELRESLQMTLNDMLQAKKKDPEPADVTVISDGDNASDNLVLLEMTRECIANRKWPPVSTKYQINDVKLIMNASKFTDALTVTNRPTNSVVEYAIKTLIKSKQHNGVSINGLGTFDREGLHVIEKFQRAILIKRQVQEEIIWLQKYKLPNEIMQIFTKNLLKIPLQNIVMESRSSSIDSYALSSMCLERYVDNFVIDTVLEKITPIAGVVYVPSWIWSIAEDKLEHLIKNMKSFIKPHTKIIVSPVNLQNNHWGVVAINFLDKKKYFDEGIKVNLPKILLTKIEKIISAVEKVSNHINRNDYIGIKINRFNFPLQSISGIGSSSCGVAALCAIKDTLTGNVDLAAAIFQWKFTKMD